MRLGTLMMAALAYSIAVAHPAANAPFPVEQRLQSKGNQRIPSFDHAKMHLRILYAEHPETLYSGCAFTTDLHIDYDHCAYRPRKPNARANRVEWEHVVPAEAFGRGFIPWRIGDRLCQDSRGKPYRGRRCAQRVSAIYRHMEADLYNLYPEIGEVNQIRSNHPMDVIADPKAQLWPLTVRSSAKAFEPRAEVKGDVARTYLYMHEAYPGLGILSSKRRKLFNAWSAQDPADTWECRRAARIEAIQGNVNRPVKEACRRQGLWPPPAGSLQRPPKD